MYWDICCWWPLPTRTYKASCAHEQKAHSICIVGTVNGCGYDDQQKYTICDACRLCHLILSILRPIFHWNRPIRYVYNLLSRLDLEIRRFLCPQYNNNRTECFTPCACVQGNNYIHPQNPVIWYTSHTEFRMAVWQYQLTCLLVSACLVAPPLPLLLSCLTSGSSSGLSSGFSSPSRRPGWEYCLKWSGFLR